MSLNLPSRQLAKSASTLTIGRRATSSTAAALVSALHTVSISPASPHNNGQPQLQQRRHKSGKPTGIEGHLQKQSTRKGLMDRFTQTRLAKSIFDVETDAAVTEKDVPRQTEDRANKLVTGGSRDPLAMARAVDPDPRSREMWQRRAVVRMVRQATDPWAREPKALRLQRTERVLHGKSEFLPTSVKKLVHLARQISGKTVAEALAQMRFSKKKTARDVAELLRMTLDQAVVERGMGLGKASGEIEKWKEDAAEAVVACAATAAKEGEGKASWTAKPLTIKEGKSGQYGVKIRTRDGRWVFVDDPTRVYISEAWVGRGPWRQFTPDYRAMGRHFIKKSPSTSISVVLKEEKTRIREYQERETRKARRGPWIHLPDRPVTAQRQYYSW